MESIQITAYETSDPEKLGCVVHCLQQKVSKSKGLIICADKSGSMNTLMDGSGGEAYNYNSTMLMTPMPAIPRSISYSPFKGSRNHSGPDQLYFGINPNTRLGCVKGFLERIIEMYEFLETTQGLQQELTIILFDDRCDVFSTMESCSYKDMKRDVAYSLRHNGGTNFDVALKTIDKYRNMSSGEVEVIFLSDGSHCDQKIKKEQIVADYSNSIDLAIGVGERGTEFDEATLRAISKEFVIGESSKRIRDVVSERALGIVTMLGRDLTLRGAHIGTSNMTLEKDTSSYKWPEMSMLMELYFTTSRNSTVDFSYTLKSGEQVVKTIDFSSLEIKEDTEYGDKIHFCLDALTKLEEAKDQTNSLSLLDRIAYLEKVKTYINESKHLDSFKDTRLGVYLTQLREQLDKLLITRDEQKFLDLAQNINKDAFRSTSAITSQTICTPLKSNTSVIGTSNNNVCVVCGDENAKREVVYVPCGHFVTCANCSVEWNKRSGCCPYCNQTITGCVLVELSEEQKKPNNPMRCPSCNIRRVNLVSDNCKHAFSCTSCVAKEKVSVGSVTCKICNCGVDKVVKIFI
jgi:hypothetical protein